MIYIKDYKTADISLQYSNLKYYYLRWKRQGILPYRKESWHGKLYETEDGHQILGPTALVEWK